MLANDCASFFRKEVSDLFDGSMLRRLGDGGILGPVFACRFVGKILGMAVMVCR